MEPEPRSGRYAFSRSLPILIGILIFGGIIGAIALRTIGNANELQERFGVYGPLAAACDGEAVPLAAPYEQALDEPPTVVFRQVPGGWAADPASVPDGWWPDAPEDAMLVLCLQAPAPLTVPSCAPGEDATRVYGEVQPARLVAAHDAAEIASAPVTSTAVPGCFDPDSDPPEEIPRVTPAQIRAWLEQRIREQVEDRA
jgi:hypothetical protein